jgi:uncharacterized membrane protein YhaH (DUF805 family)
MSPMFLPLRRYAEFTGRSGRAEFWLFALFLVVGFTAAVWLDIALGLGGERVSSVVSGPSLWASASEQRGGVLTGLFGLAMLIPWLAVSVRRLHDVGWSGWWLLIWFVPLAGGLLLLILDLTRGERGPNRYGPDPLGGERLV